MTELNTQIELIVSEIIGATRKAKTLEDLGQANTNGVNDITKLVKKLTLGDVSGSFEEEMTIDDHLQNIGNHRKVAKMIYAINMLRDAECEDDVLNAIAIKEELNWMEVQDELKDRWNDYFGDAKKYLP